MNSHNSRRILLRDPEDRRKWMSRKLESGGCLLLDNIEGTEQISYIRKQGSSPFVLNGFHYSGILQITDPEKFGKLISAGIGPERAYGYGMLLVTEYA